MKAQLFAISVLAVSLAYAVITPAVTDKKTKANPSLASYASHLQDLNKVTSHPLHMSQAVAMMCAAAPINSNSPHVNKYFDVYISPLEAPVIETGLGTYPAGSVILKRKYADPAGEKTELYTGMVKRARGYNPTSGDWEYFVLSADGTQVEQSGHIASCMACHQAYASSDFVTREYFTHPANFTTGTVTW